VPKTILIVDDDEKWRTFFTQALAGLPVTTLAEASGEAALAHFKKGKEIDLVILDLEMPVLEELDFLNSMRNELKSKAPIIYCSDQEALLGQLKQVDKVDRTFLKGSDQSVVVNTVKEMLKI
jgi:CheY-like chemotaxis protein